MSYPILYTEGLTKRFGSLQAVTDLNLEVSQGDIYGFLGLNGAGKTTTIRLLLRLIRPSAGRIRLYGKELTKHYLEIMQNIGSLVEIPAFYPYLSGRANLKTLSRLSGNYSPTAVQTVLEWVGLISRADDKVRHYSQGMRQRLGIAQALLPVATNYDQRITNNTPLVILDEPTNGLDPQGIADIRNLIKQLVRSHEVTFFISSHLLTEIELLCNRVGIIKEGKLVKQGLINELLGQLSPCFYLVASPKETAKVLANNFPTCKSVEEKETGELCIKISPAEVGKLNTYLVQAGVEVSELSLRKPSLEEYFISLM